jgi:hypothetical protein
LLAPTKIVIAVMIDTYIITSHAEEEGKSSFAAAPAFGGTCVRKGRSNDGKPSASSWFCSRGAGLDGMIIHHDLRPFHMLQATTEMRKNGVGYSIDGASVGLLGARSQCKFVSTSTERWSLVGEALMPSDASQERAVGRVDLEGDAEMGRLFGLQAAAVSIGAVGRSNSPPGMSAVASAPSVTGPYNSDSRVRVAV